MDQAHIHLLIVHLPLFGAFFGMLVLAHGLWHKSDQTSIAAFNVFIISRLTESDGGYAILNAVFVLSIASSKVGA
jgi:hypothetical protein